jgi:type IV secretory pathway TraG/TraD family ATPase VirD4
VVNNHRAKLFLSGIADPTTLDHASQLVGDEEVLVPSVTRDPRGARSTTTAPLHRRLVPPDSLRCLAPGTGALVYGSLPPVHLTLRAWWDDPVLVERGERPVSAPRAVAGTVRGGDDGS